MNHSLFRGGRLLFALFLVCNLELLNESFTVSGALPGVTGFVAGSLELLNESFTVSGFGIVPPCLRPRLLELLNESFTVSGFHLIGFAAEQ